jgi:hypothetical protein
MAPTSAFARSPVCRGCLWGQALRCVSCPTPNWSTTRPACQPGTRRCGTQVCVVGCCAIRIHERVHVCSCAHVDVRTGRSVFCALRQPRNFPPPPPCFFFAGCFGSTLPAAAPVDRRAQHVVVPTGAQPKVCAAKLRGRVCVQRERHCTALGAHNRLGPQPRGAAPVAVQRRQVACCLHPVPAAPTSTQVHPRPPPLRTAPRFPCSRCRNSPP